MPYKFNPFTGKIDYYESGSGGTPSPTVADLDGSGNAGVSDNYSRGDHKHADSARHPHSNKSLLDTYTQAEADLADAVLKKHSNSLDHSNSQDHTHTNKTEVDLVTDGDHDVSAHAPSNAQKNSDITKAEIEAKLTGVISSHSHAGGSEAFPVGALFLSVVDTNPNTLLGYGTWSQIAQGQFLVGQKTTDADFDTVEETGGAKTHTHTDHPAVTHSGGAVGTIPTTGTAAVKIGTSASNAAALAHTHPAPSFTQPDQHAIQSHNSPSHLPPYFVVYIWKRTA